MFGDSLIFLIIYSTKKLSPLMSQFVSATACDGVLWCRIHNRPSKRCGKIIFSLDNNHDSDHQNLLIIDCRVSQSGFLWVHNVQFLHKLLQEEFQTSIHCQRYMHKQPVGSVASVVLYTAQPSPESNLLFSNVFRRLHESVALYIFTFC